MNQKMCRLPEVRNLMRRAMNLKSDLMRRAMNLKSDLRRFTGSMGKILETVSKVHDGCYECVDLRVLHMD